MSKIPKNNTGPRSSKPTKRKNTRKSGQEVRTKSTQTQASKSKNNIGKILAATGTLGAVSAGAMYLNSDSGEINLPEKPAAIIQRDDSPARPRITSESNPVVQDRMTIINRTSDVNSVSKPPKKALEPRSIALDINPLREEDQASVASLLQNAIGIALDDEILDEKTKNAQVTFVVAEDARKEFAGTVNKFDDSKLRDALLQNIQNLGNVDAFTINMNQKMGGEAGDPSFVYMNKSIFEQKDIYTALAKAIAVVDHELRHIARNQQGQSSVNTITEEFETFSESVASLEKIADKLLKEDEPVMKKIALAILNDILPIEQRMLETWKARYPRQ